ncbi:MAG TPA: PilZ domain-containing protein [Chthonomonadaceae bacterium]|nr:PilZ domain-containing protein [Chthonomonadaceae bacterium]
MPACATVEALPIFEKIQTTYNERAARYSVFWPVTVGNVSYGGIYGQIVNISVSGVLFLSPWPHEMGERVLLCTDNNSLPRLRLVVEVTREQECLPGWYAYGARIVEISDTERNRLRYVLQTLQGQQFDQAWSGEQPEGMNSSPIQKPETPRRRSRLRIRMSAGPLARRKQITQYRPSRRKKLGAALAGLVGIGLMAFLAPAYLPHEPALQVLAAGENSRSSLLTASHVLHGHTALRTTEARPPHMMEL